MFIKEDDIRIENMHKAENIVKQEVSGEREQSKKHAFLQSENEGEMEPKLVKAIAWQWIFLEMDVPYFN